MFCRKLEVTEVEHVKGSWASYARTCEKTDVSGAVQNFLESFWKLHGAQEAMPVEAATDEYGQLSDFNLQAGLEMFFGAKCKTKKIEDVDMKGRLDEVGLLQFHHVDLWPSSAAVRELATQMKSRVGFVYADLKKCVFDVLG